MSKKDEALTLALETFQSMNHEDSIFAGEYDDEIAAIREALAEQPAQQGITLDGMTANEFALAELYAFQEATGCDTADQLKAQPQQEPVAWMLEWTFNGEERGCRLYDDERHCIFDAESDGGVCRPLYTSPQRTWVGLTHDEIKAAYLAVSEIEWAICGMDDAVPFTRIIEAKLREKNT